MKKEGKREQIKLVVRRGFNKIADFYDVWYKTPIGGYADEMEKIAIFSMFQSNVGDLTLDLGMGTGVYVPELLSRGCMVVGLDISKEMMERAIKKFKKGQNVFPILGDAERIPIKSETVDIVISVTTLEFLPNPNKCIKEIYRILRPKGALYLGVLSSTSVWALERKIRNLFSKDIFSLAHFYSTRKITALLNKFGFRETKVVGAVYAPPFMPESLLSFFKKIEFKIRNKPLLCSLGAFLGIKALKI